MFTIKDENSDFVVQSLYRVLFKCGTLNSYQCHSHRKFVNLKVEIIFKLLIFRPIPSRITRDGIVLTIIQF